MQTLEIATNGQGLYEFTSALREWVKQQTQREGILTVFVQHTSCSLLIQENADPDVQEDLWAFFSKLVPRTDDPQMAYLRHTYEGPDDMPAHIKAAMMPVSLSIPVSSGALLLGSWQGVYLFEHRDAAHQRRVVVHLA